MGQQNKTFCCFTIFVDKVFVKSTAKIIIVNDKSGFLESISLDGKRKRYW